MASPEEEGEAGSSKLGLALTSPRSPAWHQTAAGGGAPTWLSTEVRQLANF